MNQQLSPAEIALLSSPLPPPLPTMTRKEKLLRFVEVIRAHPLGIAIFHGLEYEPQHVLDCLSNPYSAFNAAGQDTVLQQAGLTPDLRGNVTVGAAQRFFELSKHDLHEFSCDCGGAISNEEMARRIERIAARA